MKFQSIALTFYYFFIEFFVNINASSTKKHEQKQHYLQPITQPLNTLISNNIINDEHQKTNFEIINNSYSKELNYIQSIQNKLIYWLNPSSSGSNSSDINNNTILSYKEVLNLSRRIFEKVGLLHCSSDCNSSSYHNNDNTNYSLLFTTLSILSNVITKCMSKHKMDIATRILQLYVGLFECMIQSNIILNNSNDNDNNNDDNNDDDDDDDETIKSYNEPIVNFAIFPKLYNPNNNNMKTYELYQVMSTFSKISSQQKRQQHQEEVDDTNNEEWILSQKVLSNRYLIGEKWNIFYELLSYNLGCLQYYVGDYKRSRLSYEQVIYDDKNNNNKISNKIISKEKEKMDILEEELKQQKQSLSLVIYTVASHYKNELNNLLKSADDINNNNINNNTKNIKINILGIGKSFPGTHTKVQMLYNEICKMSNTNLNNTIILFIDAYDVLLFPNINNLITLFLNGDMTKDNKFRPIIFGVESSIVPYPDPGVSLLYDDDDDERRSNERLPVRNYLNSGTIIGMANSIKIMTTCVLAYPSKIGSDQRGYTRYYLNNKHIVGLDVNSVGFLTLYGNVDTSYMHISTGQVYITTTNTPNNHNFTTLLSPAVVHGNGGKRGGKEYYNNICSALEKRRNIIKEYQYNNNINPKIQDKEINNSNSIIIKPPPFTFANYYEDDNTNTKLFSIHEVINIFINHVEDDDNNGNKDIEAMMYLASKLVSIGNFDKAQFYIDLALSIDKSYTEKLYNLYAIVAEKKT